VPIVTFSQEVAYRTDAMASRIMQLGIVGILFAALAVRMGRRHALQRDLPLRSPSASCGHELASMAHRHHRGAAAV
jgi:hypothetical protein